MGLCVCVCGMCVYVCVGYVCVCVCECVVSLRTNLTLLQIEDVFAVKHWTEFWQ